MAPAGLQWESSEKHNELIMLFRTISTLIPAVKDATLSVSDVRIKETPNRRKSESRKIALLDAAAILLVRNHEIVSVISQISSKLGDGKDRQYGVKSYIALTSSTVDASTDSDGSGTDNNDHDGSPQKYRATRNPDRNQKDGYLNYLLGPSLKISIPVISSPKVDNSELRMNTEAFLSYLERNMIE